MPPEFIERERVDIQQMRCGSFDGQIILGIKGETLNLIELVHADISSQTFTILYDFAGIIWTDAWYRL